MSPVGLALEVGTGKQMNKTGSLARKMTPMFFVIAGTHTTWSQEQSWC